LALASAQSAALSLAEIQLPVQSSVVPSVRPPEQLPIAMTSISGSRSGAKAGSPGLHGIEGGLMLPALQALVLVGREYGLKDANRARREVVVSVLS
jgi:hypothetical protein